jgi:TetR/AcrR family transcriptional regulator
MATPLTRSRRAEILAAAEREFAAAGYAGGRIERIAAAAGVNKQLLFHYFDSKEGLFSSAVTGLLSRLEPRAQAAEHPAEEIRAVTAALQSAVRSMPGLLAIIADSSANDDFPREAAAGVRTWRERQRLRLRVAVEEGQRRGYFRDDIDPAGVAGVALSAALGVGALGNDESPVPVGILMADYCAWR